jgi:mono/diheme cytochrome c family protein
MNKLFIAAIILLAPTAVFAQAQAPTGSADSGYTVFMKYQCYTCHGTIGQGGGAAGRVSRPIHSRGRCLKPK